MRTVATTAALLAAAPALAHSGAHLHPHGSGNWLAVVLVLSFLGLPALLAWLRSRK